MSEQERTNPIIIIPPDCMSEENIALLRDNNICVVVAKDPSQVQFVDPIPCISSRTEIEQAAIMLSRKILKGHGGISLDRSTASKMYVDILLGGAHLGEPEKRGKK